MGSCLGFQIFRMTFKKILTRNSIFDCIDFLEICAFVLSNQCTLLNNESNKLNMFLLLLVQQKCSWKMAKVWRKWKSFPNPTIDIRYDTINNETVSLVQPTVKWQPLEKLQDNASCQKYHSYHIVVRIKEK